jgi:hypothetical protein
LKRKKEEQGRETKKKEKSLLIPLQVGFLDYLAVSLVPENVH